MVQMIDPPNGHAFGFPKPFDDVSGEALNDWLLANGYPKEWIDLFPGGVLCRILDVDATGALG